MRTQSLIEYAVLMALVALVVAPVFIGFYSSNIRQFLNWLGN